MKKYLLTFALIAISILNINNIIKAETEYAYDFETCKDTTVLSNTDELKGYINSVKLDGYDIVEMYSTDETVATVDTYGNVTGVGVGSATIYVICNEALEGYRVATCNVNVSATKVTLDPNGGAIDSSAYEVIYNNIYGELPKPTRKGYEFLGWYNEADELISDDTVVTIATNHKLYAKWKELSYREPVIKIGDYSYDVLTVARGNVIIPEIAKIRGNRDKWSVTYSTRGIATVANNGKITGSKKGDTIATVTYGTKVYTLNIKIESPDFQQKRAYVNTGETIDMALINTELKPVYKSSNTKIINVSEDGVVTGIKYGNAVVSATVCGKKYSASVCVDEPSLKKNYIEILNNVPFTMTLLKTRTKNIIWKSDDTGIADITAKGKIIPVSTGIINMHAIINNVDFPFKVKIDKPVISETTHSLKAGDSFVLKLNQTEFVPVWVSSNKKVVTVSDDGTVKALKKGRATISTKINRVTYKCVVIVTE